MKKLTVTLDEKTAAWVRVYAARHKTSVSRMVGEMLQRRVRESRKYEEAMRRFLEKTPVKINRSGKLYSRRDELYVC